jgi:hypothetical protein
MKTISICLVLFITALFSNAAQMQMLPGDLVRVQTAAEYQRASVDVSFDLVSWRPMTNVAASAGQITFVNDPQQSDPARFFRIADADETFAIAGYVDAGQLLGGVAAAMITESVTGTSVKSDATGFFHFNQRFARTNPEITLTAVAEGRDAVQRVLRPGDYGSFAVMHMKTPGLANVGAVDEVYHFRVTGGPRAGLEYSIRVYFGQATVTGGIKGEGAFYQPLLPTPEPGPPVHILNIGASAYTGCHLHFSLPLRNGKTNIAFFSGIPSTNGTLAGNGIVTWDAAIHAPLDLNGLAYQIGADTIQFTNSLYRLIKNAATEEGTYTALRLENTWRVSLSGTADPTSDNLDLSFATATNGAFTLMISGAPSVSGQMQQVAFPPWSPPVIDANPPAKMRFIVGPGSGIGEGTIINIVLSGGTAGVFTAINAQGDSMGNGTYTYTVTGPATAHFRLNYPEFGNDYDDVTLTYKAPPGSETASTFSGTQLVSGTLYPYNGTFTYESP